MTVSAYAFPVTYTWECRFMTTNVQGLAVGAEEGGLVLTTQYLPSFSLIGSRQGVIGDAFLV